MKKITAFFLAFILLVLPLAISAQKGAFPEMKQLQSPQNPRLGFVIHGGAGVIRRGSLSPEREKEYRTKLEEALMAGYKALQNGKTSMDAVQIAINLLEDSPLFNAGKGAVSGLHHVKNPINLARAVMEKSPHVMMAGNGAEKFAKEQNIELVPEKYFFVQSRWDSLQKILKEEKEKSKVESQKSKVQSFKYENPLLQMMTETQRFPENRFGTVGAVALDKDGNLAAGTSTGGMTNKKFGRIGDAPIIGAGTYANNKTCAISATGWGEYFIRLGVARDISALMEYRALPVQQAVDAEMDKVKALGGDGGVIAIDSFGNIGISFNSEGMYRAYINSEGKPVVEIYK